MTVDTKLFNGSVLVDTTTSANVALKFVPGQGLRYLLDGIYVPVSTIESSVDSGSPVSLVVNVEDGSSWDVKGSQDPIAISGGPTSGGLQWAYLGSDMKITATYPSRRYAEISSDLWDPDAPVVKLKVVVKRV